MPMNNTLKPLAILALIILILAPRSVLAHQQRIVESNSVDVRQPEVSQAFYGELAGVPVEYRIESVIPFRLYVGLLVPDVPGIQKDISAEIYRTTPTGKDIVALLDGKSFEWTPFYERFCKDNYLFGPEYTADDSQNGITIKGRTAPAGTYVIKVFSPTNRGRYCFVVGDLEEFPLKEIINAAVTVPKIKAWFFDESPLRILASPFGWGYVLILYILAFGIGLIYRTLVRKLAKTEPYTRPRNIRGTDRLIRAGLGCGLLIWAITTSWNPLLLLLSGFCLFEAIFSWCGLYAAMGKSSCPLK